MLKTFKVLVSKVLSFTFLDHHRDFQSFIYLKHIKASSVWVHNTAKNSFSFCGEVQEKPNFDYAASYTGGFSAAQLTHVW